MYILNDEAKELLTRYKKNSVAKTIGINVYKLRKMIKDDEPCMKLTAYAMAKFLNCEKEIKDYFIVVR